MWKVIAWTNDGRVYYWIYVSPGLYELTIQLETDYHEIKAERVQKILFNSFPPSAAYMRQRIGSSLVQIMACHLFGTKPLSKPKLGYCQLDP